MTGDLYQEKDWKRHLEEHGSNEAWRSEWRRDYGRVIHSPSFRRLQGKTQLYPGRESDFFRSRLTHSLEVAQIAESIARRLNATNEYFKKNPIKPRVCITASLLHDLGHPPYGHNGELALDEKMRAYGGFEGNAQTFRIVTKVEKKRKISEGIEGRRGLNLCYRTLASILKYDREIPARRENGAPLVKGYYAEDRDLIKKMKEAVAPGWRPGSKPFKTIECSIMDVADDIAYSTYDLEDSFKAGFLDPVSILASPNDLLEKVAKTVKTRIGQEFTPADVLNVFLSMFSGLGDHSQESKPGEEPIWPAVKTFVRSRQTASDGYLRTELFCDLVGRLICGVDVEVDEEFPALSEAKVSGLVQAEIETLKNYTFEAMIYSTRVRVAEFRGGEVIGNIFDALSADKGLPLMPDDIRKLHEEQTGNLSAQHRVICDFIAGMTDRYAMEFHARLHSDAPQSIFKPI